jgi:Zn-dependent protease with chaperone function
MDFFEYQDQARRTTRRLVIYFALAVALIVMAVYLAAMVGVHYSMSDGLLEPFQWWNPQILGWAASATLSIILIGSFYKVYMLSDGGEVVARWLGGRLVNSDTTSPEERRLLNVVEEMAIASGTPVPSVFLLDKEEGINAFAAGFTPADAVIGVTKGSMTRLSREELQGVIAHEFSHILNGDMLLNLRLIGVLNGILVIALIGYVVMRGSGRRSGSKKDGGGAIVLFGLALYIIGYVGVFFGRLIKSAVSRQREYLADASAVQFTRNPGGLAGALKKIGGFVHGSGIQSPRAEEISHLFFSNGITGAKMNLSSGTPVKRKPAPQLHSSLSFMATHPPLSERVSRIEPSFNGVFPVVDLTPQKIPAETETEAEAGLAGGTAASKKTAAGSIPILPEQLTQLVGKLDEAHLAYAAVLLSGLPSQLQVNVHEPSSARAVVFALLLSGDSEIRRAQFQILHQSKDPLIAEQTLESSTLIDRCPPEARLPLVDLALPALRNLSPQQYQKFKALVDQMIQADQEIDLFEYTLNHILNRHLAPHFGKLRPQVVKYRSLGSLGKEISLLLSCLAHTGHQNEEEAELAFKKAAQMLPESPAELLMHRNKECDLNTLGTSLDRLTLVSSPLKRSLLQACGTCVSHDNQVTIQEGELLRAISDALDCPMPPLLTGQPVLPD